MTRPQLTLVPCDASASWEGLESRLLSLGYPVQVRQDGFFHDRGDVQGDHRIAVCLFGPGSLTESRDKTLSLLSRLSGWVRMGLFMAERIVWDHEIVARCNEVSVWPCPEHELDVRLRRLGAHADETDTALSFDTEDLIDLNMIGESPLFLDAIARLKRFTRCDAPVLIEGETGTGKELAARAVHYLSGRREQPFIPVNCGALPDTLLENELFGHAKGAFTDASTAQAGLIAQAEKGTLFLDEVESLSCKAQVALLRFLQEKEYRPLGGSRNLRADVRIIAATNVPLPNLELCGDFRRDLLYRLNIMPVRLPSLRERADDVLCLAEHFLAELRVRYGQPEKYLHPGAIEWMRAYEWPGNIRELENLIHRQFLLATDAAVFLGPEPVNDTEMDAESFGVGISGSFNEAKARVIEAFERDYLTRLLDECDGNVSQAAKVAGKERRALGKLIKKHGIDKSRYS